ncbi:hypothetical protein Halhy_2506 [Haliscomenobacter hydrossis DSM 1100]|uniref:Uncharacterized protein n=1 Tax=Haliscomenobacter hydrossis (strain ATCC 27775 / DSM 1100 / LMG 10767 / O) TaxID=760192 RepID=F4KXK8_HALH1|nr:hypothetical protein Halhy_2506 [Haliscomenobacter hydrossis DSM 1100]
MNLGGFSCLKQPFIDQNLNLSIKSGTRGKKMDSLTIC